MANWTFDIRIIGILLYYISTVASNLNSPNEIIIRKPIKRLNNNKASLEDRTIAVLLKSADPTTVKEIIQIISLLGSQKNP